MADEATPSATPAAAAAAAPAAPAPTAEAPAPAPKGEEALPALWTTSEPTAATSAAAPAATTGGAAPGSSSPEPAAPAAEPVDLAPPPSSKNWAALTKKEKELRVRADAVKAQETKLKRLEDLKASARTNPQAVLEEFGLTYDQITDHILSHERAAPTPQDEIRALRERLDAKEKADETARTQADQDARDRQVATQVQSITNAIQQAGDKYEEINATGQHGEVFSLMAGYFAKHAPDLPDDRKHEAVLPWEKAAEIVEKQLEADTRKRMGLKKYKPAAPVAAAPAKGSSETERPGANGSPTLTSRTAQEAPVLDKDDNLPLDPLARNAAVLKEFSLWD